MAETKTTFAVNDLVYVLFSYPRDPPAHRLPLFYKRDGYYLGKVCSVDEAKSRVLILFDLTLEWTSIEYVRPAIPFSTDSDVKNILYLPLSESCFLTEANVLGFAPNVPGCCFVQTVEQNQLEIVRLDRTYVVAP